MPAILTSQYPVGSRSREGEWRPSERPVETGYVLKEVFNARMDRMEALMERGFARQEALVQGLSGRMDQMDKRMDQFDKRMDQFERRMDQSDKRMDKMESRMEKIEADVSDIKGNVKALTLAFSTLQNRFAWNIAWVGIVIGVIVAAAQHFWR